MRSLGKFLRGFLDPRIPVLFVVGAILLELISNGLYDCAKGIMVGGALGVLLLVGGSFALFLVIAVLFTLVLRKLRPRLAMKVRVDPVLQREGLIALVSYGRLSDIPATAAIRYHLGDTDGHLTGPLRHCWLIATKQPDEEPAQLGLTETAQSSARNALDLRDLYKDEVETIEVIAIGDADDPQEVFLAVHDVYRRARKYHGLSANQIIADFTGGTKSMTAGMVLACAAPDRHLEYMKPGKYLPDGRADVKAGSQPRLVDIDFFLHAGEFVVEEQR